METASKLTLPAFDVVFTSQLFRTLETASILLAVIDGARMPVVVDTPLTQYVFDAKTLPIFLCAELNERNFGVFENCRHDEVAAEYGDEQLHRWRRGFNDGPPRGETFAQVVTRVKSFVDTKLHFCLQREKTVLLCAHQNTLRALHYLLMDVPPDLLEHITFDNGQVVEYTFGDSGEVGYRSISPQETT